MNKWVKIIAVLVILGILGGLSGYLFIYNKPHVNYEKSKVDYSISADDIFAEYTNHRHEAENKYNGKVLQVSGMVSSIDITDSQIIIAFVLSDGLFGDEGIRFSMLPKYNDKASALDPGTMVSIKGYCTGYNDTDIILEKCSITQ